MMDMKRASSVVRVWRGAAAAAAGGDDDDDDDAAAEWNKMIIGESAKAKRSLSSSVNDSSDV
jgi:hypothetical protein